LSGCNPDVLLPDLVTLEQSDQTSSFRGFPQDRR
jgi:hypothetical protein